MAFLTAGSPANPPLVLVHGWLSHAQVWQQTIESFCQHYYCIAIDLLGLSVSDKPTSADYSVPAHAGRILTLLDSLGIDQFHLIGHSLGGQISLYIASVLAPERVIKLVDVSGVATGRLSWYTERVILSRMGIAINAPWLWDVVKAMAARFPQYARFEFQNWFYDLDAIPYDSWALDRMMAMNRSMYYSAYQIGQGIRSLNLTPFLHGIQAQTLVIFGTEDAVVPPHQGKLVADQVSNSRLVMFKECGHFPMYECPEQYLRVMREFLYP